MKGTLKLAALMVGLSLVVAACGSSSGETTTTDEPDATTTTVERATATTVSTEEMDGSVADVVAGSQDFSTLLAAVEAAGLTDAVADQDATLTVFAPSNDAFDAALTDLGLTAEELLADKETLTSILTYHVLGEVVTSDDLATAGTEEITVETLSGEELTVIVGDAGNVTFSGQSASVTTADVEASNGVIHVIDAVLLPPSMAG